MRSCARRIRPQIRTAYALLIDAGLYGIERRLALPESADVNLFTADSATLERFERIPASLSEAAAFARDSEFLRARLPASVLEAYCAR